MPRAPKTTDTREYYKNHSLLSVSKKGKKKGRKGVKQPPSADLAASTPAVSGTTHNLPLPYPTVNQHVSL